MIKQMKEINQEARNRYFSELQLQLRRAGFEIGEVKDGSVDVFWEGETLCQATDRENIFYHSQDIADDSDAFQKVLDVTRTVSEYMGQMERPLP